MNTTGNYRQTPIYIKDCLNCTLEDRISMLCIPKSIHIQSSASFPWILTFRAPSFFRNLYWRKIIHCVSFKNKHKLHISTFENDKTNVSYHFDGIKCHCAEVSWRYTTDNNEVLCVFNLLWYFNHTDVHCIFQTQ